MAVLDIQWTTADRVVPPAAAGTGASGEAADAETPRAEKPILVWIEHPSDADINEKIARITLDPEKVRVGCAFFTCIKVPADDAARDRLLADTGQELPRMVLITPDYEVVARLEGKISASQLYAAMKKTAGASYEGDFDKRVKTLIKLLGEFDMIEHERDLLLEKEARGVEPAEAGKLAEDREALDAREREANEKRDELLTLELTSA